jgi:SnoaL-like domain
MSEAATIVERFYAAWNGHDAAAVAGSFTAGGVYADPLTGDGLSGDELRDHVQSVLDVLRDLRIAVTRTVANENAAAVVWAAEGTWDGVLGLLRASETPVVSRELTSSSSTMVVCGGCGARSIGSRSPRRCACRRSSSPTATVI